MTRHKLLLLFFSLIFSYSWLPAQDFPDRHWRQYKDPAEAGLDLDQLDTLRTFFEQNGGSVLLVVIKGKVAISWGPPNRRFRQASARKSYMNAIYGRYEKQIDLSKTLAQIGITEQVPLTDREQKATIKDLMMTSSGIYLPSAYALNLDQLPARGSAAPGEKWFYNNWDFNVLRTIFKQEVKQNPFQVFYREIAQALEMEDFRLQDTHLYYEKDKSDHPAYLFKMSARDMARFGWLYLQQGQWKSEQILSPQWVQLSTRIHTDQLAPGFEDRGGYGLLWWVGTPIDGHRYFSAAGAGGQRIVVFPDDEMVVVHLTNTYHQRNVSQHTINEMLTLLLGAKSGKPVSKPKTQALEEEELPGATIGWEDDPLTEWTGHYTLSGVGPVEIFTKEKKLLATLGIGTFTLLHQKDGSIILEDILIEVVFQKAEEGQEGSGIFEMNDRREISKVIFYY